MKPALARLLSVALVAAAAFGLLGFAGAQRAGLATEAAAQQAAQSAAQIDHGQVYLLRGLANIWSRGLDTLGEKLAARGVRVAVYNHGKWRDLVAEATQKYTTDKNFPPIIIAGHSLGANAAVIMADKLGDAGVPVRLIVLFDSLSNTNAAKMVVSANVEEVVNFYKSKGWGLEVVPGRGFKGKINNVDLAGVRGIGHLNIEKNPQLHAQTIALILEILTGRQSASN